MNLVVISALAGNAAAVVNALRKAGGEATLSRDPLVIQEASALVLPGVGAFDDGCTRLRDAGLFDLLRARAEAGVPVLGICLGMQLLADGSEEGHLPGLGIIPGRALRFQPELVPHGRIPHMGWNRVCPVQPTPLFDLKSPDRRFYFVHSYHVHPADPAHALTTTAYGPRFVSAIQKGRSIGVQFHPEKSLRWGLDFLKRFLDHA